MSLGQKMAAVLAGAMVWCAATGWSATSDVFRLDLLLQGVVQTGTTNLPVISKVQVNHDDLINFALGRPLGTEINNNEELALVSDCAGQSLDLIVYRADTHANLATLGTLTTVLEVEGIRRGQLERDLSGDLGLLSTGTASNGLSGGALTVYATTTSVTNGCLSSLKGTMLGTFGAKFPVATGTTNYNVVVTKGTIRTKGKKIGYLVTP